MTTYGTNKFVTLIGDNARNVQKAFELARNRVPHLIGLSCIAHTLNLLCHDIIKLDAINAFISIAVDTIKEIRRSQILSALLSQIMKQKGTGEQLKLPCKTRWGSYLHALKSLLNSKAALQSLAVHEEAFMMSKETKDNLLHENFWKMVEECSSLLEPISDHIFKLNENHINDVYMAFKNIKSRILFMFSDLTMLVDNDAKKRILNAIEARKNNCLKPMHLAAYMLDPKSQGVELQEDEEIAAMEFIHGIGCQLNLDVMVDLANYRAKEGLWGKAFVWNNIENIDAVVWWKGICKARPLGQVALRCLTAPCTSAATERSFSKQGHIHNLKRNRLTADRAAKISYISYNWNLLNQKEVADEEEEEEQLSSPIVRSEMTSPNTDVDQQPSTSRESMPEVEFFDIDAIRHQKSSDSDSD